MREPAHHLLQLAHLDPLVIGLAVALKGSFGIAAQLLPPLAQKRRMDLMSPRHAGDRGSRLESASTACNLNSAENISPGQRHGTSLHSL